MLSLHLIRTASALLPILIASPLLAEGFTWKDEPGKHTDLLLDGKPVARYMYEAIDESTPQRREATYKPFHHVYNKDGSDFITKGAGGKYTHHRGIYYGFSKTRYTDASGKQQSADTWHCKGNVHQSHQEVLKQEGGADKAVQRVRIDWHGVDGSVIASEERQLTFHKQGEALVVDFESTLSTELDKVTVDGDPQHAGFQFRAHNDVNDKYSKETYYLRPGSGKGKPGQTINWSNKTDDETTRDLAWKGQSFRLGDDRYTVVYLDRPDNPKPARFSERDYGRFGSYFVADLTPDKPLTVKYRLVIQPGELSAEDCAELSESYLAN